MSKPRHADKDSAPTSSGPKQIHHLSNYIFLFLLTVFLIAVYTFLLQKSYSTSTLEANVDQNITCSDAIHKLVSNTFTRDDFTDINTVDNMSSERYQTLQTTLNQIRSLNSTRYLYTAKRNSEGKLIYLVDGLDLDTSDFAYPGTYIEDEMIPYINSALSGKTIYSQEIIDTTWGHIFTACYPVKATDGSNEIIGALCIEMDMESAYTFLSKSSRNSLQIAIAAAIVALLLLVCVYHILQNQRAKDREQQMLLRKSAAAAEAANKAKSAFLFDMSHDIRTPMNAIMGFTRVARNHLHEPDKILDCLDKINLSGSNLQQLINDVLDISRIESGEFRIDSEPVKLSELCKLYEQNIRGTAEDKNQKFICNRHDIIYDTVLSDRLRIGQIYMNLLSNAVKYTPEGGTVELEVYEEPFPDKDKIRLVSIVRDNGIGMSEKFMKEMYSQFSRAIDTRVNKVQGSGLGLAIVKKIVDQMNGTIEATSRLHEGTTFRVTLDVPFIREQEVSETTAEIPFFKLRPSRIIKTLLIAEDNDLNYEILEEQLEMYGIHCVRAVNGKECVQLFEIDPSGTYDAILMDMQMPVMNGLDATRAIRRLPSPESKQIPIIALTANAYLEDVQKCKEAGMNDHMSKPVQIEQIIRTVERAFRLRKQ